MPIKVWNSRDHSVHLRSFDNDSVMIPARAKGVLVANKFSWQVPAGVTTSPHADESRCPSEIVRGRAVVPARRPPRSYNKAGKPLPENTLTAAQMREKVAQIAREREGRLQRAELAKQAARAV